MPLLTREILAELPPLHSGVDKGAEALVLMKFFTPDSRKRTWYASEFDGKDTFFGIEVVGDTAEIGYFLLWELLEVYGTLGMPVEINRHYTPQTFYEVIEQHRQKAVLS